jgi:lysyl-tRNA synthetase class 1
VFEYPPPYPSQGRYIGKAYEFFTIGGKKMSTSKGAGASFRKVVETIPPQMLRYLLVRTRPWTVIDFDPETKNDLVLLSDRYDRTERIYYGKEQVDDREKLNNTRIYELSHIGEISKEMTTQIPLTHAATVIQIGDEKTALKLLQQSGHAPKSLSDEDKNAINERLMNAKQWLLNFAPKDSKFELTSDVSKVKVGAKEKKALKILANDLEKKVFDEKTLHNHIYDVARQADIEPKQLFFAAYKTLINKEKGPRLASFIMTIGVKKVAEMFNSL